MLIPRDEIAFEGYCALYTPISKAPPLGTSGSRPVKSVKVSKLVPL